MNERGWKNYLYSYAIARGKSSGTYAGPITHHMVPGNYPEGIYGGSGEFRVCQWNVRSTN
jgi:hypothetical protein